MKRLLLIAIVLAAIVEWSDVSAKPGCCSRHGGVCGCECCDGTPLSAKCAPYYPDCSGEKQETPESKDEYPFTIQGKAVQIQDGDTISVMKDGRPAKVRLRRIDCPERAQAFGAKAKEFTAQAVGNKMVTVQIVGKDNYDRYLGEVTTPDGKNLNEELVKAGLAWWYKEYDPIDPIMQALEQNARTAKIGLWADANPTPPWEHRTMR